ncbi:MAG: PfkB family carbohydrate kinase [Candidatus Aminicenantaceae bacterium]
MSLVIVGSLAFDTIETPEERKEKIVGGSCTYCSLAASYFTTPKIVGVVGEDFPQETIDLFKKRKIDMQGLEFAKGKTFHWEGLYGHDPNQRTTVKLELNVFADFKPQLPPSFQGAEFVFLANIHPKLQEDIRVQFKNPKWIAMDTITHWIEKNRVTLLRVLKKCHLFFCNDEEIKLLTDEINLLKAGKKILELGPAYVVIKKGEHGALMLGKDFVFGVLAHPCEEVVDPTGAGDSFAGGFLGYLDSLSSVNEKELRQAAVYGSVMASFAIEDFGIERFKSVTLPEIKKRYSEFKKFVTF